MRIFDVVYDIWIGTINKTTFQRLFSAYQTSVVENFFRRYRVKMIFEFTTSKRFVKLTLK